MHSVTNGLHSLSVFCNSSSTKTNTSSGVFHFHCHHTDYNLRIRSTLACLFPAQEDLCGQRGLLPGTEQQTFEIFISREMRTRYDRIMSPITMPQVRVISQLLPFVIPLVRVCNSTLH